MDLTHINKEGRAKMVDVGDKDVTERVAKATGTIFMKKETVDLIKSGGHQKGDVLSVAQVAGISAAKETFRAIPMCHILLIDGINLTFNLGKSFVTVDSIVRIHGKTGVEMEALHAVEIALLTIYDMCKAVDPSMRIENIRLLEKTGGKSDYKLYNGRIGKVLALNISEKKGVKKTPIDSAQFKVDHGMKGDAHAGNWHRQVSLLDKSSIDIMRESGLDLKDGDFAENITTEGMELYKLPVGSILKIGESIQEVTQIGKECHNGCAIKNQVGECIMPTQGIFTKVIKNGEVFSGDPIIVL